jgi:hypothetical protein
MQIQTSTETPKLSLRNLTLTTHGGPDCGGYNVWIEIDVGHQTCITSIIDEFSPGDTLLWFGKFLGSCRSFHFGTDLDMINFRVKTKSTDKFCPLYFYAFMENEQSITFRSDYMSAWHGIGNKNHTARRTYGDFTLPIAGNFKIYNINCTKMVKTNYSRVTSHCFFTILNIKRKGAF